MHILESSLIIACLMDGQGLSLIVVTTLGRAKAGEKKHPHTPVLRHPDTSQSSRCSTSVATFSFRIGLRHCSGSWPGRKPMSLPP